MTITITEPNHSAGNPAWIGPLASVAGVITGPVAANEKVLLQVKWQDQGGVQRQVTGGWSFTLGGGSGWSVQLGTRFDTGSLGLMASEHGLPGPGTILDMYMWLGIPPSTLTSGPDLLAGHFRWDGTGRLWLLGSHTANTGLDQILAAVQKTYPSTGP